MSGSLAFYSEFWSSAFRPESRAHYRIEIHGTGTYEEKEVTLAGERPAELEWGTVDKEEPVQGSALTLRLVSESDRAFAGLYSTETGTWRVRILRDGGLYWSGTVDTELYSEPYYTAAGYEVEVTASDFGPMDRADFGLEGRVTLGAVVRHALEACKLEGATAVRQTISTRMTADSPAALTLDDLYVEAANFYDEEGKPMTRREAAEGVLRPLGLRMVQRGGRVEIFDLNGAWEQWPEREVYWTGADSELGTDKTYNKVRVRLSTYGDNSGADGSLDHDTTLQDGGSISVRYMVDTDYETAPEGFDLYAGAERTGVEKVEGLTLTDGRLRLMRIDSIYSGSDAAGLIWNCKRGEKMYQSTDLINKARNPWEIHAGTYKGEQFRPLMSVGGLRVIVPSGDGRRSERERYMLKVSMDLLLDVRYNPFEGESRANEEGNYGRMKGQCQFMYVPVAIKVYNHDNVLTAWYDNRAIAVSTGYNDSGSRWRTDSLTAAELNLQTCSWLAWYDWSDRNNNCGIGGWATNKQTMGRCKDKSVPRRWEVRGDGCYIPLPPVSGYVTVTVGHGVYMSPGLVDDTEELRDKRTQREFADQRDEKWRWLAYKDLRVEVVEATGKDAAAEDLEDSAWITRGAAEPLEIETVVGTPGDWALPSARALLTDAQGGAVRTLHRAGVTDRVERLLIGTAYSQHSQRRTTLSGSCEMVGEMVTLTDASAPEGERYIMLGEVQDLGAEQSEITMAAYGPDDWEGLEVTTGKPE